MKFHRIYALSIRHLYLIKGSFPRILDLIYWPTIQIILWGFISQFFTMYSDYYNNTIGVILSCAILYDFLFRSSISFNMLFLEEIWSRNFTNLFVAPLKVSEIITALTSTALLRNISWNSSCNNPYEPAIWSFFIKNGTTTFLAFFKFIFFRNNIGLAGYLWTFEIWTCL